MPNRRRRTQRKTKSLQLSKLVPTVPSEALMRVRLGFDFILSAPATAQILGPNVIDPASWARFAATFSSWRLLGATVYTKPIMNQASGTAVQNFPGCSALLVTPTAVTVSPPTGYAQLQELPNTKLYANSDISGDEIVLRYKTKQSSPGAYVYTPTTSNNEILNYLWYLNYSQSGGTNKHTLVYGYLDFEFKSLLPI